MINETEVDIHPTVHIDCEDLQIGKGTVIGAYTRLVGTSIHIGRDSWIGANAYIGGGSAFDPQAFLAAGHFFHLGDNAQINTARGTVIGDEVAIGVNSRVFCHGVWLSELDGYPSKFDSVLIGDRVWMPYVQINPGVSLGEGSVYIPGSTVSQDQPSYSLIAGNPAKVIKKNYYPRPMSIDAKVDVLRGIVEEIIARDDTPLKIRIEWPLMIVEDTEFDVVERTIQGSSNKSTEIARHQLRRHGIRFRYEILDGEYVPWFD